MEEQDLREIGISDPQHRRKLLQAARSLPKVTAHSPAASARARALPLTPPRPRTGKGAWLWGMQITAGCVPPILGAPEDSTESCLLLPQVLRPQTVSRARGTVRTWSSLRRGLQASTRHGSLVPTGWPVTWSPFGVSPEHLSLGQPVLTAAIFPWAARAGRAWLQLCCTESSVPLSVPLAQNSGSTDKSQQ